MAGSEGTGNSEGSSDLGAGNGTGQGGESAEGANDGGGVSEGWGESETGLSSDSWGAFEGDASSEGWSPAEMETPNDHGALPELSAEVGVESWTTADHGSDMPAEDQALEGAPDASDGDSQSWRQDFDAFAETVTLDSPETAGGERETAEHPQTRETGEIGVSKDTDADAAELINDAKDYLTDPENEEAVGEAHARRMEALDKANPSQFKPFESGEDGRELLESWQRSEAEWEQMSPAERAEWERNFWDRAERELDAFRNMPDHEYENLVLRRSEKDARETEDYLRAQTEGNWAERMASSTKHWWSQEGGSEKVEATMRRLGTTTIAAYEDTINAAFGNRGDNSAADRHLDAERDMQRETERRETERLDREARDAEDQRREGEDRRREEMRRAESERQRELERRDFEERERRRRDGRNG